MVFLFLSNFLLIRFFLFLLSFSFFFLKSCLASVFFFNMGGVDLGFFFLLDVYSVSFRGAVLLISSTVFFYSIFYIGRSGQIRFSVLVLFFLLSMLVLIFSPSLLRLILGWDGLGVTSFLLVIYYNNASSLRSGVLTVYINRFGDVILILSFFYFYCCGLFDALIFFWCSTFYLTFCIIAARLVKSAQLPFSSWLPAAISAPTPVSALVHSSTLVTAGVYLIFRFFFVARGVFSATYIGFISLVTSFRAGLMACREFDLKKMVAISTLSQLGLIIFAFSFFRLDICFFHLIRHALFKSLIFLCCGVLICMILGNQDMRFIGSKIFLRKSIFFILIISNLSLCGGFFLSGFYSKDMIIESFLLGRGVIILFFMLVLSCIFSIFYSLKMIFFSFRRRFFSFRTNSVFFKKGAFLLFFLFLWSIFLGYFFSLILFEKEPFMGFIIYKIVGGILLLMLIFRGFVFYSRKLFIFLIISIVYLNWFTGGVWSGLLYLFNKVAAPELMWLELSGPKGASLFIKKMAFFILDLTMFVKVFILRIVVFLIYRSIILLFSLFKASFWRGEEGCSNETFFVSFRYV